MSYVIFNYVDDFMSIDNITRGWASFNVMGNLLRDLGVHESLEKSVQPTHILEFLGVLFDLLRQLIFLPHDKLAELNELLDRWLKSNSCTEKQLQSLAGKTPICGHLCPTR